MIITEDNNNDDDKIKLDVQILITAALQKAANLFINQNCEFQHLTYDFIEQSDTFHSSVDVL